MGTLDVFSLAERPDLAARMWSVRGGWPTFMVQSLIAATRYERATEMYPDLHLVALDGDEVVARVHAVPVRWPGTGVLPQRGWDWALESGVDDPTDDRSTVSLIEARVSVAHQGRGLSRPLLTAAAQKYRTMGTENLLGPVRPNGKVAEPRTPIAEYAARTRNDGLPADSWLRVHARMGGHILGIAALSMTIPGTLADWRHWTGMPFDTDGLVNVDGALAPVLVDTAQDHAVYIEPNIWVQHALSR